jgi:hypothetical protein
MEETTTTNAPVDAGEVQTIQGIAIDDQGQAISQPEDTDQAQAAVETTETENTQEATSEPSEDEQLTKFATAKGVTLDSDNAKKLAKMAMNAEKAMHSKATRASELERTMSTMSDDAADREAQATGQNPELLRTVRQLQVDKAIRNFWEDNPDARQYEREMADIAVNAGLYGTAESILKASYAMAAMNNQGAVKSQGKREALESLAHKQQAAVPTGNAVNSSMTSNTITPQNVEQMVARNSQEWFVTNYDAINKAMRG